jgi:hypothetical protein
MASTAAMATGMAAAMASTAAATTKDEGGSLVFTADEGDSNQGEKQRQSKNNNTVHPQILQLLTGTVSGKLPGCRHKDPNAVADGSAPRCDRVFACTLKARNPKRSLL